MRAVVVVRVPEGLQVGVELVEGLGLVGLPGQPHLGGLLEPFDLAAGGGVVRSGVLLSHAQRGEFGLEGVAAAANVGGGVPDGVHHAVVGQGGCGAAVLKRLEDIWSGQGCSGPAGVSSSATAAAWEDVRGVDRPTIRSSPPQ